MPIFSRPYLYGFREASQYSGFNKFMGDFKVAGGVNPKYWNAAMSGGIFLEIWPFKNGHGLNKRLRWGLVKVGSFGWRFFICKG
jgi:hypothetical protein